MANETKIQELVHRLEQGKWKSAVQVTVLVVAIGFLVNLWFFRDAGFKGLSHEKAMEQAQIARELARGNGFTTLMIRPAALWLFEKNKGAFPLDRQPDIYHAPLNPWVESWFLLAAEKHWPMTEKDIQYTLDRVIAGVGIGFFLLAVIVNYFTARRLFDHRLAVLGMGLCLLCQQFWDFALSGLPQMLMLFLFSGAMHTLLRALEARHAGRSPLLWIVATGLCFGLLALTHAMTTWIFVGLLVFVLFAFRPLGREAAVLVGVFLLCYGPWMVRNYVVCGTPVGLGWYSGLAGVRGTESIIMRSAEVSLEGVTPVIYRQKIQGQALLQLGGIYGFLGQIVAAPLFFIALLHLFKGRGASMLRWAILSMWFFALVGMSIFGLEKSTGLNANDLHVLFIPLMTFYGLAFILVMWSRLEINVRLLRIAFLSALFILSALPFAAQFLELVGPPRGRIAWPPYCPPYIAILHSWTNETEIIASDMPWAVAWYADRKSLWLPMTIKEFSDLNDYQQLNGQIVGLYLTPVSGSRGFIQEIVKGEYKEWAPFIMRNVNMRDFPLKYVTALPIENECIFYSDRDRWTNRDN